MEILDPFSAGEFAAACRRLGRVSTYRLLDDPVTAGAVPGLGAGSCGASPILLERLREAVTRRGGRRRQGYGRTRPP
ncbi:hypothetical protein ABZ766_06880 [Streptomyces sp. NPDC006670]|uniref:hypothetical protein n=1 Tax=Streptomyces sp. NPDC006670 TaxID=3154476 RepID=UPI0033D5834A